MGGDVARDVLRRKRRKWWCQTTEMVAGLQAKGNRKGSRTAKERKSERVGQSSGGEASQLPRFDIAFIQLLGPLVRRRGRIKPSGTLQLLACERAVECAQCATPSLSPHSGADSVN